MTEITDLSPTDSSNTEVTGESLDGSIANMGRMDNTLQAVMGLLARSIRTNVLRFLDDADPTKKLAFDLSGITTGTTRTVTFPNANLNLANALGSGSRNRIVNGDMRVSQENGTNSGTTNGFYPVDQWAQYRVTSAGTLTVAQVASVTPAGSPNRLRATVTVADASLAAGEYWVLTQNLEGSNVADFQWGSASGKQVMLRFGFKGPAGTYAVSVQNYNGGTPNRSYVATFTIAAPDANTDTVQTIAIPPSTSGTWGTANGVIGATLNITLASGSTFQGSAGWNNSNVYGTSAVSNGMGTGSAVFELFDVGLRLDPDATGVYGAYEVGEVDAVYRSERYYLSRSAVTEGRINFVSIADGANLRAVWVFGTRLCKPPAITSGGGWRTLPGGAFANVPIASDGDMVSIGLTSANSFAANGGWILQSDDTNTAFIRASARLS